MVKVFERCASWIFSFQGSFEKMKKKNDFQPITKLYSLLKENTKVCLNVTGKVEFMIISFKGKASSMKQDLISSMLSLPPHFFITACS